MSEPAFSSKKGRQDGKGRCVDLSQFGGTFAGDRTRSSREAIQCMRRIEKGQHKESARESQRRADRTVAVGRSDISRRNQEADPRENRKADEQIGDRCPACLPGSLEYLPETSAASSDASMAMPCGTLTTYHQGKQKAYTGGNRKRSHRLLAHCGQYLLFEVSCIGPEGFERRFALQAKLVCPFRRSTAGSTIRMFSGCGELLGKFGNIFPQLLNVGLHLGCDATSVFGHLGFG